jgi:hypothetical protein
MTLMLRGFPSWFPDRTEKSGCVKDITNHHQDFDATASRVLESRYDETDDTLRINGLLLDRIFQLSCPATGRSDEEQIAFYEECGRLISFLPSYSMGETLSEVIWKFPVEGAVDVFFDIGEDNEL